MGKSIRIYLNRFGRPNRFESISLSRIDLANYRFGYLLPITGKYYYTILYYTIL